MVDNSEHSSDVLKVPAIISYFIIASAPKMLAINQWIFDKTNLNSSKSVTKGDIPFFLRKKALVAQSNFDGRVALVTTLRQVRLGVIPQSKQQNCI